MGRLLAQDEDSQASADQARDREFERKLVELTKARRRTSLTGPVILTSIGLGMLVSGGGLIGLAEQVCQDAKNDPTKECDESARDTLFVVFGVIAAAGGIMAIVGGTRWRSRLAERRKIDRSMQELRKEHSRVGDSLASLHLGTQTRDGNRYLTMGFNF